MYQFPLEERLVFLLTHEAIHAAIHECGEGTTTSRKFDTMVEYLWNKSYDIHLNKNILNQLFKAYLDKYATTLIQEALKNPYGQQEEGWI